MIVKLLHAYDFQMPRLKKYNLTSSMSITVSRACIKYFYLAYQQLNWELNRGNLSPLINHELAQVSRRAQLIATCQQNNFDSIYENRQGLQPNGF